ncbi:hypothetical protein AVEN_148509-1 [Araneus ventricosus]|uniref:Uncharacterized protein n=1 Tax=Araneus ventricosus TaxID=182803 RepID=A0A4Y2JTZ4_ARAVE|nr:hypothetical protein AVEN_148509-1 [Araneus ventricosus]
MNAAGAPVNRSTPHRLIRCIVSLRGSLIRARTGSGDPEVPELPSARGVYLGIGVNQSSTFSAPVFDHRSCPFSPSMSDSTTT